MMAFQVNFGKGLSEQRLKGQGEIPLEDCMPVDVLEDAEEHGVRHLLLVEDEKGHRVNILDAHIPGIDPSIQLEDLPYGLTIGGPDLRQFQEGPARDYHAEMLASLDLNEPEEDEGEWNYDRESDLSWIDEEDGLPPEEDLFVEYADLEGSDLSLEAYTAMYMAYAEHMMDDKLRRVEEGITAVSLDLAAISKAVRKELPYDEKAEDFPPTFEPMRKPPCWCFEYKRKYSSRGRFDWKDYRNGLGRYAPPRKLSPKSAFINTAVPTEDEIFLCEA